MATVEYERPSDRAVKTTVSDYQMTSNGGLAIALEDGETRLLSPQTEWVVLDD